MNTHDNDSEGYLIPENEADNSIGYVQMVNAHVMHRYLNLKQDFDTWFNDCVEKLDLKEGVDFVFTRQEWNKKRFVQNLKSPQMILIVITSKFTQQGKLLKQSAIETMAEYYIKSCVFLN